MPANLPADTAAVVRETIGGAVSEAERIGGPLGATLLEAARDAYATSFQVGSVVCAVVALLAAVVAAVVLRNVEPAAHEEEAVCADAEACAEPERA
jgi:DHA2 family multidrug resistance protein-like MFS transporter